MAPNFVVPKYYIVSGGGRFVGWTGGEYISGCNEGNFGGFKFESVEILIYFFLRLIQRLVLGLVFGMNLMSDSVNVLNLLYLR